MNFIDCKIVENGNKVSLVCGEDSIVLPDDKAKKLKDLSYIGKDVMMGIRPENIVDKEEFISQHKDAVMKGKVEVTELLGAETLLYLNKEKVNMTVRVNGTSQAKAGDIIEVALDSSKIHVFDKETEKTIF